MLKSWIKSLELPLEQDENRGWKPHGMFRGATPNVPRLGCHVSVLDPGVTPHPPHEHVEEELLIILEGEADLILVDDSGLETTHRVRPGFFSYYPSGRLHTLRGAGSDPVTYLMFKWSGDDRDERNELGSSIFEYEAPEASTGGPGFVARGVFEGPTRYLRKLHAHTSILTPGGGYPAHADDHDVAIILREGTVEIDGQRIPAPAIVFHAAGELHGIGNPGNSPARYLVFEFHR